MDDKIPHIAMPFAFGLNGEPPLTDEQDSDAEIQTCVENILRYRKGYREDIPDFGLPDYTFAQMPISAAEIFKTISEYEPRARPIIEIEPDKILEWAENVGVKFVTT